MDTEPLARQAIHAGWVIPVVPRGTVLENHTVVLAGNRIEAILPTVAWSSADGVAEIDCRRHAVMPGLINAHSHAAMSLMRGLADDLPLMTWLEQHIWPVEAQFVDREFVRDGARLAALEMLRGGVTCFNDMYFFADDTARAAIEAGIRAVVGIIVIGFPSAWAADTDEYFSKGHAVHDRFRDHPLITSSFAPHAPYTVDDRALSRIATQAEELDLQINIHLHETAQETRDAVAQHGTRPLARLDALGLVSPRLNAIHMTDLGDDEIARLAAGNVNVVHCPESNLKLASGFCPVARLLDAGVNVALGTDGAASNNDLDMFSEMRTAALLAKGVAGDACAVPAATALEMATLNGARALGLDADLGSLEAGKLADLIAVDLSAPGCQPVYDAIAQLVYSAHRDQVSDVWVGGRRVVHDGTVQTLDAADVVAAAAGWRDRIAAA